MADVDTEGLVALLRWYEAMGVDAVVDAVPHDRFAAAQPAGSPPAAAEIPVGPVPPAPAAGTAAPSSRRALPSRAAPTPPPAAAAAGLFADAAVSAARDAAGAATTLDELRATLDAFEGCGLKRMASRLVFADGAPGARVMVVGEAPGADEDRSGVPFVGRAGQLLDRMLGAVGLTRRDVYIANVVPWRPPGNREPTPQEVATCLPFIRRQVELCDPDILLLMGKAALQALTPSRDGITRARGRWLDYDTGRRGVRALPMLHPAYLLRQPAQKKFAWRDLRALRRALDGAAEVGSGPGGALP